MGLYALGKYLLAQCEPQREVKLCVCVCVCVHAPVLGVSVSRRPWKDGLCKQRPRLRWLTADLRSHEGKADPSVPHLSMEMLLLAGCVRGLN